MENIANQNLLNVLCGSGDSTLAITNPANGSTLGYIATQSKEQIEQILDEAHKAQKKWQKVCAKERSKILKRWFELIIENQDDLARIMTLEQGKPYLEAKGEVVYGASFIEWFAEEAKRTYGKSIPTANQDQRLLTIKQPVGVACAITPWNFPIAMITRKAAPALAAGCSFVVKPAKQTPLSAYAVAELAYQAGIPKDLFALVCNKSASLIGNIFSTNPLVRKLSFTGSTEIGRLLMEQCASSVKRTSMELGGNAPFIVFDDADIDKAVEGAIVSKFRNAGQTCVCANRFYVQQSVYSEFVEKFALAVDKLKVGNGLDEGTAIGPVIDKTAKEKIEQLTQGAIAQGAKKVSQSESYSDLFISPVILRDVTQSMDIVREEIFGPVAPVIAFENEDELIEMANDTIYGLAGYFYSRDIGRIWRVAEALEYGMLGINVGVISNEAAPFGGVKQSGIGREGAQEGIEEYMDIKYLCVGGVQS